MAEHFDCIIVLGSQIGINEKGKMVPAFHTEMKARAAGIAWQQLSNNKFILTGGYNIGVRYAMELDVPVYGTPGSDKKPDFSEEAKQRASRYRSEASVIAEVMKKEYGIPLWALLLEEESATTQQNAEFCADIVEDLFWSRVGGQRARIGILTLLYHMERALKEFKKAFAEKKVDDVAFVYPLFAENLLSFETQWVDKICQYYSVPKGGKQWDVKKIRRLLSKGKSLNSLLT
ncbi:MAG: YdcF family protein [Candidatus Staskawiczbacteria bacterium]|nr:YdcF family protein [Candidatus Staskawiczbacteria bacterium]